MTTSGLDTIKILIVDGKRANPKLLRGILLALGIRNFMNVEDSTSALQCLTTDVYDAVFCDETIAPMNPAVFAKTLRRDSTNRNHRVPVILMSDAPQRRLVEIARDCGINDFLAIPLSVTTVRRKLEAVMFSQKEFVRAETFVGPDRRRRGADGEGAPAPAGAAAPKPGQAEPRKWTRRASDEAPPAA
jgi:two-component system chemotaxis response regulator CheY